MKRIVQRPFARRRSGGWVFWVKELIKALKDGDAVQVDKVTVGTKELCAILRQLPWEDCQVKSNGKLEIETVRKVYRGKGAECKAFFEKPRKNFCSFSLVDKAWVPPVVKSLVVLKPQKYA